MVTVRGSVATAPERLRHLLRRGELHRNGDRGTTRGLVRVRVRVRVSCLQPPCCSPRRLASSPASAPPCATSIGALTAAHRAPSAGQPLPLRMVRVLAAAGLLSAVVLAAYLIFLHADNAALASQMPHPLSMPTCWSPTTRHAQRGRAGKTSHGSPLVLMSILTPDVPEAAANCIRQNRLNYVAHHGLEYCEYNASVLKCVAALPRPLPSPHLSSSPLPLHPAHHTGSRPAGAPRVRGGLGCELCGRAACMGRAGRWGWEICPFPRACP